MEISILSCILCLIFTFIALHLILSSTRRKPKLPPGPRGLPIIGNLLDIGDKPHKSLARLAKAHGPIMSLKLGQVTAVVVSSPETIRQVLQTHDHITCSRAIPDAAMVFDHHQLALPWLPVAPTWRNIRRIYNTHLFSPNILDANENLQRTKLDDLLENVWRSAVRGEAVDIGQAVFAATLNMMSNSIWSVDLADPNSEMAKEFKATLRGVLEESARPNISDFFPGLKKMDIQGIRRRITVHLRKMLDLIDGMIDQRLKMQKSPDVRPKNDMLHHLLNMVEQNGEIPLDRNQIKHSILVLFIASTDTTTAKIQWTMAYLLQNSNIMSKAKEELQRVIGKGNSIQEMHIDKLPYLQAIVKETLRLQSSLLIPRRAKEEVTIAGFTIPKDTQIMVNSWAVGRYPNIWENPNSFIPERFLGSDLAHTKGRSFEFIPFGNGRRICPGQPWAVRVVHLMVGSLIHWFDWELEHGTTSENLNMDDKFGTIIEKAHPLRAVPLLT